MEKSIRWIKSSREMEERFMIFEEMMRDEKGSNRRCAGSRCGDGSGVDFRIRICNKVMINHVSKQMNLNIPGVCKKYTFREQTENQANSGKYQR